jgi:hypothetical protein
MIRAAITLTANSFISATNMRLSAEIWRKEAGLLRISGTVNLPNII